MSEFTKLLDSEYFRKRDEEWARRANAHARAIKEILLEGVLTVKKSYEPDPKPVKKPKKGKK